MKSGDPAAGLPLMVEGMRHFPEHSGVANAAVKLARTAKDQSAEAWALNRRNSIGPQASGPPHGFFKQRVPLARVDDRMDLFRQHCTGKKVLHVGCTDYPIFDSANNLHIQLNSICAQLDGLDLDELGLDELRLVVPGRYFTRTEDITEHYDVLLVPETIEHVDDLSVFFKALAGIDFDLCLITAPNAFLPTDNGNFFENSGTYLTYVEHVHPDHNMWFSPYTLRRCITKFTPWKVRESYLVDRDTVVACLCERRPRWELERIPKKVHFYWGNDSTSFLRFLSVWSFRKLNPDWEINVYVPARRYEGGILWGTGEGYDGAQFKGRDYSRELFSIPGLQIKEIDFSEYPDIAKASENYKSDFFRWHILSTEGGVYSDIDLFYLRPMTEFHLNLREHRDADAVVCLQEAGNIIGFLMSAAGCELYRRLLERSTLAFNTQTYQAISAPMVNEVYPSMEAIRAAHPESKVLNMPMSVVYAIDHLAIPDIFTATDMGRLKPHTIGIHWYAGHPVAQQFNNAVDSENYRQLNGILFQAIKAMYETD